MQSENYSITPVDATGSRGNVKMIRSLVTMSMFPVSLRTFNQQTPTLFSIEDVWYDNEGVFRPKKQKRCHWYVLFVHTTPEEKIMSE